MGVEDGAPTHSGCLDPSPCTGGRVALGQIQVGRATDSPRDTVEPLWGDNLSSYGTSRGRGPSEARGRTKRSSREKISRLITGLVQQRRPAADSQSVPSPTPKPAASLEQARSWSAIASAEAPPKPVGTDEEDVLAWPALKDGAPATQPTPATREALAALSRGRSRRASKNSLEVSTQGAADDEAKEDWRVLLAVRGCAFPFRSTLL